MSDNYPNLDMPPAHPHVPNETAASSPSSFAAPSGSAWEQAKIHFEMAKAAMKLAAKSPAGAIMVIEHLEKAAASLRKLCETVPAMTQCPKCQGWHGGKECLWCGHTPNAESSGGTSAAMNG